MSLAYNCKAIYIYFNKGVLVRTEIMGCFYIFEEKQYGSD